MIKIQDRSFHLYKYFISVNNKKYQLGALDLLEYIAFKIEEKHGSPDFVPQLPYKSIDLLFDHYGLSYLSDDIRLCISEFCLYNDNPMRILFGLFLKNDDFKKTSATLTYQKVSEELLSYEFNTTDGKKETIADKHNRRIEDFAVVLVEQYNGFREIIDWVLKIYDYVKTEFRGKFVFSDIYNREKDEVDFITYIKNNIGLPLVMNKRKKYCHLPSEEFVQFYVLQKFMTYILSKNTQCPIYSFCRANDDKFSGICNTNPRLRINDTSDCPYIMFLKTYGLSGVKFNKNGTE